MSCGFSSIQPKPAGYKKKTHRKGKTFDVPHPNIQFNMKHVKTQNKMSRHFTGTLTAALLGCRIIQVQLCNGLSGAATRRACP